MDFIKIKNIYVSNNTIKKAKGPTDQRSVGHIRAETRPDVVTVPLVTESARTVPWGEGEGGTEPRKQEAPAECAGPCFRNEGPQSLSDPHLWAQVPGGPTYRSRALAAGCPWRWGMVQYQEQGPTDTHMGPKGSEQNRPQAPGSGTQEDRWAQHPRRGRRHLRGWNPPQGGDG